MSSQIRLLAVFHGQPGLLAQFCHHLWLGEVAAVLSSRVVQPGGHYDQAGVWAGLFSVSWVGGGFRLCFPTEWHHRQYNVQAGFTSGCSLRLCDQVGLLAVLCVGKGPWLGPIVRRGLQLYLGWG